VGAPSQHSASRRSCSSSVLSRPVSRKSSIGGMNVIQDDQSARRRSDIKGQCARTAFQGEYPCVALGFESADVVKIGIKFVRKLGWRRRIIKSQYTARWSRGTRREISGNISVGH
jgi:hypothetical protein